MTKEKTKEIIDKYVAGKSISALLLEYPQLNRREITSLLRNNNITIRGGRSKKTLTDDQIEKIKIMIANGAFLNEIANELKLNKETLKLRLDELNIKITNTNRVNRRIRSDYFSSIDSPEKAYWLGLLFTDGSVDHYGHTGRIRLQLQEQDIDILEKFKEDLQLDCKIIYNIRSNSTCCSIEFVDEQIYNDLAKYDIIPKKTYTVHNIPYNKIPSKFLSAYALGLFDGDGSLSYSKNFSADVTINYTAYYETEVQDFQNLINLLINNKTPNKNFFTSAWHTQWRGRSQVLKILDQLYSSSSRYINRKYQKYIELKNSLN